MIHAYARMYKYVHVYVYICTYVFADAPILAAHLLRLRQGVERKRRRTPHMFRSNIRISPRKICRFKKLRAVPPFYKIIKHRLWRIIQGKKKTYNFFALTANCA